MSETRENKNIAASNESKNMRAPAKKKFPMLQMWHELINNLAWESNAAYKHSTVIKEIVRRQRGAYWHVFEKATTWKILKIFKHYFY